MTVNRLVKEARHRAEGYWLTSRLVPIAVCAQVGSLIGLHDWRLESWARVAGSAVVSAVAFLMERRWRHRAQWLATTDRWWERLEEAPTVLPFPRLSRVVTGWVDGLAARLPSWRKGER